ncbi:MAG: RNA polymerase factor sigma-32 [Pseudomonadota bacterium]
MTLLEQQTSLDSYMKEISQVPILSREEELGLAIRFRENNDLRAAQELTRSNLRFVVLIANEYRSYGVNLLDLIQEGNLGLMRAIEKFDPERGYRLISYAVWWIRAYVQNFIVRSLSIVKMATNRTQKTLFYKNNKDREEANDSIENYQCFDVLREKLAIADETMMQTELVSANKDFSLDQAINDDTSLTYLDLIPTEGIDPEENVIVSEEERLLREVISRALIHLNEREEFVITHRVMADDPLTLQQIASKFNLSKERIRQIEREALEKVKGKIFKDTMLPHSIH